MNRLWVIVFIVFMLCAGCERGSTTDNETIYLNDRNVAVESKDVKNLDGVLKGKEKPIISGDAKILSAPPTKPKISATPVPSLPKSSIHNNLTLINHAQKDVGIKEATGRNDGLRIEAMQKFSGGSKGDPYCAFAIVKWHWEVGLTTIPRSGWSPDLVSQKNVSYSDLMTGDVMGLYFASKGRIAHAILIKEKKGDYWITIEANTGFDASFGSDADRNGDGIWNKRRPAVLVKANRNKFSRYWR